MKRELVGGLLLLAIGAAAPLQASLEPITAQLTSPSMPVLSLASSDGCPLPSAAPPAPAKPQAKAAAAPRHDLLVLLLLNVAQGMGRR